MIADVSLPNMADFVGSCTRVNWAAALVIAREWERGTMEAALPNFVLLLPFLPALLLSGPLYEILDAALRANGPTCPAAKLSDPLSADGVSGGRWLAGIPTEYHCFTEF